MIVADELSLRIGARELLHEASFRVSPGMRVGLVGRNGAGKTTLLNTLAGEVDNGQAAYTGTLHRSGQIAYLPQDTRAGGEEATVRQRVLQARGLDGVTDAIARAEQMMAAETGSRQQRAMERYARLEAEFVARGGWSAEAEAARLLANLGLDEHLLHQELHTLSGGQRRRVELARILFSGADTLLLDEPTNHLDADSLAWLRDYLMSYSGGLLIISHDVELLQACVNNVFHLDATRAVLEVYHLGWDNYLAQREIDANRRRRERATAERKAASLFGQAEKLGAKATKAVAAKNMARRAETMLAELAPEEQREKVADLRFPDPAPCGKVPLTADGLSKGYGSLDVFTDVSLAIDRGSRVVVLGLNGAGKTTLLRLLAGVTEADSGRVVPGHGLKLGYYAQEHDTLDTTVSVAQNLRAVAPDLDEAKLRAVLGSFLFSGADADKPAGVLSGGEKTRLALAVLVVSSANVLLLDEPTNNLDPVSRREVLAALRTFSGAIVLVTHDEGAVAALDPERVLLLPDGDEDMWSASYEELVALA